MSLEYIMQSTMVVFLPKLHHFHMSPFGTFWMFSIKLHLLADTIKLCNKSSSPHIFQCKPNCITIDIINCFVPKKSKCMKRKPVLSVSLEFLKCCMRCKSRVPTNCPDKWHSLKLWILCLGSDRLHSTNSLVNLMSTEVSNCLIETALCTYHLGLIFSFFYSIIKSLKFPVLLKSTWSSHSLHNTGCIWILIPITIYHFTKCMDELLFGWLIFMIIYSTHFTRCLFICFSSPCGQISNFGC